MTDPFHRPYKKYTKTYAETGSPIIPIQKIKVTAKPVPNSQIKGSEYIRFSFVERPYRFYRGLSYHWQAFIKTAILSFTLFIVPYQLVLYFYGLRSRAEIMAKTDPTMTADRIKAHVRDRKEAKKRGEGYESVDASWFKKQTSKNL